MDEGFGINIIIEQLRLRLGLLKLKHAPYNLKMADQTTTKEMGFIRDMKIYVHNIPYRTIDAPPNSLKDSTLNPKVQTTKG